MGDPKKKAVINVTQSQLHRINEWVRTGRYRTVSDFFREAADEKLVRLDDGLVADAVERYCAAGHADEDVAMIEEQAFDAKPVGGRRKDNKREAR